MNEHITLSHGGGGIATRDLVADIFLNAFGNPTLSRLEDSAVLDLPEGRTAFTTDCFVIKPIFFRGGDIGRLAVAGTVNDLAVSGAKPLYLALGLVLEEGWAVEELRRIARSIGETAEEAGVKVVAGDTKVVERGSADKVFITTTGVGVVPRGRCLQPENIQAGDHVIISGPLGDHGIAVLSEREGLHFDTPIVSDVAPLGSLVEAMTGAGEIHAMRDLTRGGAAAALNEIADQAGIGIMLWEKSIPVREEVAAACEMLGLDPISVANEGKLAAFVAEKDGEAVLEAMKSHSLGGEAEIAGVVTQEHGGMVVMETFMGGKKIVEMPHGEGLPRIC